MTRKKHEFSIWLGQAFIQSHFESNGRVSKTAVFWSRSISLLISILVLSLNLKPLSQDINLRGINAFDQWGVELGKHLAEAYAENLVSDGTNNQITNVAGLVQKWREK